MVLIIHDRTVSGASTILPGGGGFTIIRDVDTPTTANADIDIVNNTTLVTNGPGGVLTNTSLDGGNWSNHGYALSSSLPGTAVLILSRTLSTEIVTFAYPFGSGWVIYSTIPLDFYLGGGGNNPPRDNMTNIYAPNVIVYGASLFGQGSTPVPTMNEWGMIIFMILAGLGSVYYLRRQRRTES